MNNLPLEQRLENGLGMLQLLEQQGKVDTDQYRHYYKHFVALLERYEWEEDVKQADRPKAPDAAHVPDDLGPTDPEPER